MPSAKLPSGYLPADFLRSTGSQWIDTGLGFNQDTRLELKCAVLEGSSKYPWAASLAGSYKTSLKALTIAQKTEKGMPYVRFGGQFTNTFAYYLPSFGPDIITTANDKTAHTLNNTVQRAWNTANYWKCDAGDSLFLFKANGDTSENNVSKSLHIYSANISNNGILQGNYIPALDETGTPCMFDTVTQTPFYNVGSDVFRVGMTVAQARQLNKLPAGGGTLYISLPMTVFDDYANVTDEGINNAIDTAKSAGWNFIIIVHE